MPSLQLWLPQQKTGQVGVPYFWTVCVADEARRTTPMMLGVSHSCMSVLDCAICWQARTIFSSLGDLMLLRTVALT